MPSTEVVAVEHLTKQFGEFAALVDGYSESTAVPTVPEILQEDN